MNFSSPKIISLKVYLCMSWFVYVNCKVSARRKMGAWDTEILPPAGSPPRGMQKPDVSTSSQCEDPRTPSRSPTLEAEGKYLCCLPLPLQAGYQGAGLEAETPVFPQCSDTGSWLGKWKLCPLCHNTGSTIHLFIPYF